MRHREREADTGRGRSRLPMGSPMWDSIPGPQDHTLSQRHQTLNHWTTQASHLFFPNMKTSKCYLPVVIFSSKPFRGHLGISGWASAFGSGCDPGVLGSSPASGYTQGACFSLCLCLCLSVCVSHEKNNKSFLKRYIFIECNIIQLQEGMKY